MERIFYLPNWEETDYPLSQTSSALNSIFNRAIDAARLKDVTKEVLTT